MVNYLLSNFSTDMIAESNCSANISEISEEEFNKDKQEAVAIIRHPAFARILHVPMCKKFIQLYKGDTAIIIGTDGGKLDYNARELPSDLSLKYRKVEIVEVQA
ncbi:MAG: hypothetical protein J6M91_04630 [Methanobrevibacter sp.]|nr:hypothetical protein [Methanobrevibacter sp.]